MKLAASILMWLGVGAYAVVVWLTTAAPTVLHPYPPNVVVFFDGTYAIVANGTSQSHGVIRHPCVLLGYETAMCNPFLSMEQQEFEKY